jgi:DNA-binding transcriptional ArsR family regulator/uncharacterized protein YndB with AHSA1/START domain
MLPNSNMKQEIFDSLWKALSDSTRRSIMDQLREGPKTTGELSELFSHLSRFAIMKHTGVLEKAGLIIVKREGKYRWNHINPIPIQHIYERWVKKYEAQWAGNLLQLKNYSEQIKQHMNTTTKEMGSVTAELEVQINATVKEVWYALTKQTGSWWRKDFYTSSNTRDFILEPKLGGLMYEDAGNGEGLVWATVIGLQSPNLLELKGHLTPAFGGPAISFIKITLEEAGTGTLFKLSDTTFGEIGPKLKQSLTEGWQLLFAEGMKEFIEKRA